MTIAQNVLSLYVPFLVFALCFLALVIIFLFTGAQLEIFQGRGGFVKLGHFDKQFIKKSRKKAPHMKNSGVFSLRYS